MGVTNSKMCALGTTAPNFSLTDTTGKTCTLDTFKNSKALLVIFMCNHCPYVKHVRTGMTQMARDFMDKGVAVVAINSNDSDTYPEDSYGNMKLDAKNYEYPFPYLWDQTQETAKAYCATCTPDFFLFDKNRKLIYRGQMDDSRLDNGIPVTGNDLRMAVQNYLNNQPIPETQKPSTGCSIKWKTGNDPGCCKK